MAAGAGFETQEPCGRASAQVVPRCCNHQRVIRLFFDLREIS